jgi:hypothetical protein
MSTAMLSGHDRSGHGQQRRADGRRGVDPEPVAQVIPACEGGVRHGADAVACRQLDECAVEADEDAEGAKKVHEEHDGIGAYAASHAGVGPVLGPRWLLPARPAPVACTHRPPALLPSSTPVGVRLEAAQEDGNERGDVLLVGEAVGPERREERLAATLGQDHADKGAGTGPGVVRSQPTEFDLLGAVRFDEVEDLADERTTKRIGQLWTPD